MSQGNDAALSLTNAIDAIQKNTGALQDVIEKFNLLPQSAKTYETFVLSLSLRQPTILLSMDSSRTRALIRANVADVFVGKLSTLASQGAQGYPLPTGHGDEFKNMDELYVIYNPQSTPSTAPVLVAVLVERNSK